VHCAKRNRSDVALRALRRLAGDVADPTKKWARGNHVAGLHHLQALNIKVKGSLTFDLTAWYRPLRRCGFVNCTRSGRDLRLLTLSDRYVWWLGLSSGRWEVANLHFVS